MRRPKRTAAQVAARTRAAEDARELGRRIRDARQRRRLTQHALADQVGVSRSQVLRLELGRGARTPLETWHALAAELQLTFTVRLGTDPQREPADAGHLAIQELVLTLASRLGATGSFELPTKPNDPARSVDAHILDRARRRMIVVECWNSFGDFGAAARSSSRKLADLEALAVALGGEPGPLQVGLCWVVRATARNRTLIARYPHLFDARFPGGSAAWVRTLTAGGPMPSQPGLVWCDVGATQLYARRRRHAAGE
jgi:transcriptional regulator with XRE-family HTH domain